MTVQKLKKERKKERRAFSTQESEAVGVPSILRVGRFSPQNKPERERRRLEEEEAEKEPPESREQCASKTKKRRKNEREKNRREETCRLKFRRGSEFAGCVGGALHLKGQRKERCG